ncbi:MAG TPA: DMT family transporter [Aggregatilineaceae bacterium]|nr:DMT family transporter [Aggregatilineaceae bacterium]
MAMGSGLSAVGFGLAASLSWGTSDFSGGLAAKRIHIFGVMTISYGLGVVLLVVLVVARSEPLTLSADLAWAAAAGMAGAAGLAAQYRALAVGRMGIAAPTAAALSAMIPVLFSAVVEGLPGSPRIAGFILAIIGVWFLSRSAVAGEPRNGLGLAVVAGIGFGLFFVLMDQVRTGAVFWPLVSARAVSFVVVLGIALASRQKWQPEVTGLPVVLLAGALDVGGNIFFLLAAQAGRLDVASVLSSLYPAVTVLLARMVLHERLTRTQGIGVVAALIAVLLIAA